MSPVTAEQVAAAAAAAGRTWIPMRRCSICEAPIGYQVQDGNLYFDGSCGCGSHHSGAQPRTWQDAADYINGQPTEASRAQEAAKFGITAGVDHG